MKRWMFALFTFFALTVQAVEPVIGDADRLKQSQTLWEKLRDKHQGNYTYQVSHSSFIGAGSRTTIVVRENKVVERIYEKFGIPVLLPPDDEKKLPMPPKWKETGKELGSHSGEGAPVMTVDELYTVAAELLSKPVPEFHRQSLAFDDKGVLSHCFQVNTMIQDDAPIIGVAPFKLLMPPMGK